MISVRIVTNTNRKTIVTDPNNTIRQVLEHNEVNYDETPVYLDGAPLQAGDHDKMFSEIGIAEKCILTAVKKTENA